MSFRPCAPSERERGRERPTKLSPAARRPPPAARRPPPAARPLTPPRSPRRAVIRKYLQHAFSEDAHENLGVAAEEVYGARGIRRRHGARPRSLPAGRSRA
jgi:hypothetical protein